MPSATVCGALMGLAFHMHANSLRKGASKHPIKAIGVGMVLANLIVIWDNDVNAQHRKQMRQRQINTLGLGYYEPAVGQGTAAVGQVTAVGGQAVEGNTGQLEAKRENARC